jgi:GNAT superfamily N-acetyltransferase
LAGTSDYVSVKRFTYTLSPATPQDLRKVLRLVREAAKWLRNRQDTDQWARPWPDAVRYRERLRSDLIMGKTWLVWDDTTVAGTITIDTNEPLAPPGEPLWPTDKRHELALYVRRVIVKRSYGGQGIGAALLDWAAEVAKREHGATLIRVDVWTTNKNLHKYYLGQRFTRCPGRDPQVLGSYPSQALFERDVDQAGTAHTKLFFEKEGQKLPRSRWRIRIGRYSLLPRRPHLLRDVRTEAADGSRSCASGLFRPLPEIYAPISILLASHQHDDLRLAGVRVPDQQVLACTQLCVDELVKHNCAICDVRLGQVSLFLKRPEI